MLKNYNLHIVVGMCGCYFLKIWQTQQHKPNLDLSSGLQLLLKFIVKQGNFSPFLYRAKEGNFPYLRENIYLLVGGKCFQLNGNLSQEGFQYSIPCETTIACKLEKLFPELGNKGNFSQMQYLGILWNIHTPSLVYGFVSCVSVTDFFMISLSNDQAYNCLIHFYKGNCYDIMT